MPSPKTQLKWVTWIVQQVELHYVLLLMYMYFSYENIIIHSRDWGDIWA